MHFVASHRMTKGPGNTMGQIPQLHASVLGFLYTRRLSLTKSRAVHCWGKHTAKAAISSHCSRNHKQNCCTCARQHIFS